MNTSYRLLTAIALFASLASAAFHHNESARPHAAAASPCITDSSYQRLAFWIGDWDVYDSTGNHYATQRVHAVVDACAITAEWTGRVGDKGLGMSAFDARTREWKQVYVSNQVPSPAGVTLRRSDPAYTGPGVRFIPLLDTVLGDLRQTRVTIMPLDDHRALQQFEDSPDGGKTWHTVFKAEHRLHATAEP
jgi:hypothetical protein